MVRTIGILSVAVFAAALAGCGRGGAPAAYTLKFTPRQKNFEAVWEGSLEVLRKYDFTIDRTDRRAGVITTLPLTGQQWWEFWRGDAATRRDLAESTIQTIYREAKVTILPQAEDSDAYRVNVEVQATRADRPSVQVSSTSDAFKLYVIGSETSVLKEDFGARPGRGEESTLDPLGRDTALEQELEAEIAAAARRRRAKLGSAEPASRPAGGTDGLQPG